MDSRAFGFVFLALFVVLSIPKVNCRAYREFGYAYIRDNHNHCYVQTKSGPLCHYWFFSDEADKYCKSECNKKGYVQGQCEDSFSWWSKYCLCYAPSGCPNAWKKYEVVS